MKIIKGKFNRAVVYTDVIDTGAIEQIKELCDSPDFASSKIRIMPDVHAGASCTIGTTMTVCDKIVPSMVGVDIGCGVEVIELAEKEIDFPKLDEFIKKFIPSGVSVRDFPHSYADRVDLGALKCAKKVNLGRGLLSIGTLGGGNHFIEVDRDDDGTLYLVVHTGSRHLGVDVAEYYQKSAAYYHASGKQSSRKAIIDRLIAEGREKEIESTLQTIELAVKEQKSDLSTSYLEGELMQEYLHDMGIMQAYADLNRRAITDTILGGMGLTEVSRFTTVHNYVDLKKMILRKGAVSAKKGEALLIPINMRDGALICEGKGNPAWNESAPHGAGRLLSRTKARKSLSLEEFERVMDGIYSSTVNADTLDESPMAYKGIDDILSNVATTVTVKKRIYPVYNFKASESPRDRKKK